MEKKEKLSYLLLKKMSRQAMRMQQKFCKKKSGVQSIRSILLSLVVCVTFLGNGLLVHAEVAWPQGPEITWNNAIVMEANSGAVLYEKNAHEEHYPASITKILTALLAVENSTMEEKVTFSYDSVHKTEGSSIWRDVDEVMTMEECLHALMLNSANECAYAVAEHVGGTYDNFIKMMNDKAKALGCSNTNFVNPHGLTEENHYTSCYDMALIAREAIKNEAFRKITGTKRYDIPPTNKHPEEITYLTNKHKMLWEHEEYYYEYCIGGKTGYTEAAGSTLVTYAEKDGMTLICVVMRSKSPNQFEDTITLLDYCFENFAAHNISENIGDVNALELLENEFLSNDAFVELDQEDTVVLPKGVSFGETEMEVIYDTGSQETAGILQYTYGERVVGSADISVTVAEAEEYSFEEEPVEEAKKVKEDTSLDAKKILLIVGIVLLVAAAAFGIYKLKENFYLIRYNYYYRKGRDFKQEIFKRKRRRRRR